MNRYQLDFIKNQLKSIKNQPKSIKNQLKSSKIDWKSPKTDKNRWSFGRENIRDRQKSTKMDQFSVLQMSVGTLSQSPLEYPF